MAKVSQKKSVYKMRQLIAFVPRGNNNLTIENAVEKKLTLASQLPLFWRCKKTKQTCRHRAPLLTPHFSCAPESGGLPDGRTDWAKSWWRAVAGGSDEHGAVGSSNSD